MTPVIPSGAGTSLAVLRATLGNTVDQRADTNPPPREEDEDTDAKIGLAQGAKPQKVNCLGWLRSLVGLGRQGRIMDRIQAMRIFTRVVETNSFNKAAEASLFC